MEGVFKDLDLKKCKDGVWVDGLSAVFNVRAPIGGSPSAPVAMEEVDPYAFDAAINDDRRISVFCEHFQESIATRQSGTFTFWRDGLVGIRSKLFLPSQQEIIIRNVELGILNNWSYGAWIATSEWWEYEDDGMTIYRAMHYDLYEFTLSSMGSYKESEASIGEAPSA